MCSHAVWMPSLRNYTVNTDDNSIQDGCLAPINGRLTHLYILYLVENPWRFFSTKSMYSGEWWKGPLSDRSQSRGPPGPSVGGPPATAPDPTTVQRKHTQQCRLRLTRPHRAIREGGGGTRGRDGGVVWVRGAQQPGRLVVSWLLHWLDRGSCITSPGPLRFTRPARQHSDVCGKSTRGTDESAGVWGFNTNKLSPLISRMCQNAVDDVVVTMIYWSFE